MTIAEIALLTGAYLLGSIPYMLLLGRARGIDLSKEEDLHIAMWRKVGRLEGLSGVLVDVLKGAIPVLIGFALDFRLAIAAFAGVAALVGQMWPVFRRFDGERGNTTGLVMIITLSFAYNTYLIFLSGAIIMLIGFGIRTIPRFMVPGQTLSEHLKFGGPVSNSLPLGMAIGFAVMPLVSWLIKQPLEMTLALTATFVAIIVRRLTVHLRADLKTASISVKRILINRLLFDRSYL